MYSSMISCEEKRKKKKEKEENKIPLKDPSFNHRPIPKRSWSVKRIRRLEKGGWWWRSAGKRGGALARGGSGNRRGGSTAEAMRIWLISNSQTRRNRYISRRLLSIGDYPGDIARIERRSFLALSQCEREHLLLRHRVRFMYQYIYIIYYIYVCVETRIEKEKERERVSWLLVVAPWPSNRCRKDQF